MNGQDNYQYEEEQEKLAMMKQMYLPMKNWFLTLDKSFAEKYDNFPAFWRDLDTWPHFRIMKKLYLAATEKTEAGLTYDILELEKTILQKSNPVATEENPGVIEQQDTVNDGSGNEEKKRKRRNRWGDAPPTGDTAPTDFTPIVPDILVPSTDSTTGEIADNTGDMKKPRRSRWSTATTDPSMTMAPLAAAPGVATPGTFQVTAEIMQQTIVLQMQLKTINEKLLTVEQDARREELNPDRSPSPPPKYDSHGKRTNTRDVRMRETLTNQRTRTIEEMMRLNPLFQPPADFVRQKPFRRIYIPYKDHPTYNFIGLIIGPRGNTQKRMERETGCKISIRGKGSVKEGSKGRAAKQQPDEDDELHCFVQGETEENVERASKMVMELLVPVEDDKNEHKQKQLRELALINGTLREDEFCTVCGEKGHKHFECPQRTKTFQAAGVRCAICGDQSHPTRDCPMKQDAPTNEIALDSEYNSFMAELGDDDREKAKTLGSSTGNSAESSEKAEASAAADLANGVKVERKGQQTVIHVTSILTGLPPTSSASTPGYPVGVSPSATGQPAAAATAGYYGGYGQQWPAYPPNPYAQAPGAAQWGYYQGAQQGQQAMDPAMAAYYGYNATAGAATTTDQASNADAYAQYYAQYGQQQQAPPPPSANGGNDVNMG